MDIQNNNFFQSKIIQFFNINDEIKKWEKIINKINLGKFDIKEDMEYINSFYNYNRLFNCGKNKKEVIDWINNHIINLETELEEIKNNYAEYKYGNS